MNFLRIRYFKFSVKKTYIHAEIASLALFFIEILYYMLYPPPYKLI